MTGKTDQPMVETDFSGDGGLVVRHRTWDRGVLGSNPAQRCRDL